MRFFCKTIFDITATGVKNNFHKHRIPFVDDNGCTVTDIAHWTRSRNQQRNWETINQIISLRTLPVEISIPIRVEKDKVIHWYFEFTVDQPASIELNGDPVGSLSMDCQDVPMIVGLDENTKLDPRLQVTNNIWFGHINNK
jgi:hypothetical protein